MSDDLHLSCNPNDPEFVAEQQHLSQVHQTLRTMAKALVEKMEAASAEAAADKLSLREDIAPNFATMTDAFETYADFATINQVIDAYNASQTIDAEKLANIRVLLRQPYFAKVALQFRAGEEPKELYIGAAGATDDQCRRLVVDWRSPVAEVYYNQENGHTSYRANGRVIDVDLKLRRQFELSQDVLHAYFDTTVAIQDALLLSSLSKQRSAKMQAITATIQKEQNQVIRHDDVPALLVSGIAGSGKTSVLMQRIAYLFYQRREDLKPEQVYLITPNPVFAHYIDNVLPDLGEQNPHCLTWLEFAQELMPADRSAASTQATPELLQRIDRACDTVTFEPYDFKEIRLHGERLISAPQITQVAAKFRNIPAGPHLAALMREELLKRLESRLAQLSVSEKVLSELSLLTPNEQVKLFHETFNPHDEDEVRQYAMPYIRERFEPARKAVENDEWLRVDRIGKRLLGEDNLSAAAWLYLKCCLTGLSNPDAQYVMIDEVQDYTVAQLMVLARYFRRAHFMLLGDPNQAIVEGTASFEEVRNVFLRMRGSVATCQLMTSYRSAPPITNLFANLLTDDERLRISSIRREEELPEFMWFSNVDERNEQLVSLVKRLAGTGAKAAAGAGTGTGAEAAAGAGTEAAAVAGTGAGAAAGAGAEAAVGAGTGAGAAAGAGAKAENLRESAHSFEAEGVQKASRESHASSAEETAITGQAMGVKADTQSGLVAIIVPYKKLLKGIASVLEDCNVQIIDSSSTLPAQGVVLTTLKLAKGLEFDHVILPNVSERFFPDTPLARHQLYTSISRATKRITLMCVGAPTPLLIDVFPANVSRKMNVV